MKYLLLAIIVFTACYSHSQTQQTFVDKSISDSALLDTVERRTFNYFWEGAEPASGMAPERIHMDGDYPDKDPRIIATGGSGFGVMAIIAAIERGYITRKQGFERFQKIISFLEKADRF